MTTLLTYQIEHSQPVAAQASALAQQKAGEQVEVVDGSDDITADELQRTEDEEENGAEGDLAARALLRKVTNGTGTEGHGRR